MDLDISNYSKIFPKKKHHAFIYGRLRYPEGITSCAVGYDHDIAFLFYKLLCDERMREAILDAVQIYLKGNFAAMTRFNLELIKLCHEEDKSI